jgi:hypothetical protein
VIVLDEVHLRRMLAKYFAYYNAAVTCRSPAMPRNPGWSRGRSWARWSNFPRWEDSTIDMSVLQRDERGSRAGSGAADGLSGKHRLSSVNENAGGAMFEAPSCAP